MHRVAMVLFLGCCSFLGGVLAVVVVGRAPTAALADGNRPAPAAPDGLTQRGQSL